MAKPAARVLDFHECPMSTGPVPHVGGPIAPPVPATVNVGGFPAARVGDLAVCVGPPDSIAEGSSTVNINGKPAARKGDHSAHGGEIVTGCDEVMIGG
jgi:uncharacterized Zn-binding protein involved in type VI secretion